MVNTMVVWLLVKFGSALSAFPADCSSGADVRAMDIVAGLFQRQKYFHTPTPITIYAFLEPAAVGGYSRICLQQYRSNP